MELEAAIAFTDAIVFKKLGFHLSDLQQAMLRESWSWQRQSYDQIAETYGYSSTYLKHDVGPKLWKLISQALEEKVNKTSFRAAIERRFLTEAPPAPAIPLQQESKSSNTSWSDAPDVQYFYDRDAELVQLQGWILDQQCRLIAVLGMGGIGKTSLSVKLAQQLQNQFEWIIWRSLRNAPSLHELLTDLLQVFVQEASLPETIAGKVSSLLKCLRSQRCLIVLDNAEGIAKTAAYNDVLRQIGETRHQSCVVLTSREMPDAVRILQGETLPVRSLRLSGLSIAGSQQLFSLKGQFSGAIDDWNQLITHYSGNPLALKIISTTIQTVFNGNIADFLSENTFIFGNIRNLIQQQFEDLPQLEKTVLYWLAIDREAVSFAELRSQIFPKLQPQTLIDTLEALEQRSLIEKHSSGFSLQPVVMEYTIDQLVQQVTQEILSDAAPVLLKTHALLNPQTKDYIRETQIRLILTPILEQISMRLDDEIAIASYLMQRLRQFQGQPASAIGYAGGNLLNLICQQQNCLANCDLSRLILWQADLRQTMLDRVNLAHSDLSHSAFTEPFGIVFSVAFSPDGNCLAIGDAEGRLKLWQVSTGELLLQLNAHQGWIWSLAFSPDGRTIASGSSDKTIRLWDTTTGDCLKTLAGHTSSIWSVAFSENGKSLASGSDEFEIRLWNLETGQCKQYSGHTGRILTVAFSRDGKWLASGSDDRTVRLWNLKTGNSTILAGHDDRVWSVAFSPANDLIASGSADRTIRLWSIQSGQCIHVIDGHEDRVRSLMFSQDAQTLVSSGDDQTVRVWQVHSGHVSPHNVSPHNVSPHCADIETLYSQ